MSVQMKAEVAVGPERTILEPAPIYTVGHRITASHLRMSADVKGSNMSHGQETARA